MPNPVPLSIPTFYGVKMAHEDGNYGTEVVRGNLYKVISPFSSYTISIMSLSLQSTYKLVSGYEIPVVGFGVSTLASISPHT